MALRRPRRCVRPWPRRMTRRTAVACSRAGSWAKSTTVLAEPTEHAGEGLTTSHGFRLLTDHSRPPSYRGTDRSVVQRTALVHEGVDKKGGFLHQDVGVTLIACLHGVRQTSEQALPISNGLGCSRSPTTGACLVLWSSASGTVRLISSHTGSHAPCDDRAQRDATRRLPALHDLCAA